MFGRVLRSAWWDGLTPVVNADWKMSNIFWSKMDSPKFGVKKTKYWGENEETNKQKTNEQKSLIIYVAKYRGHVRSVRAMNDIFCFFVNDFGKKTAKYSDHVQLIWAINDIFWFFVNSVGKKIAKYGDHVRSVWAKNNVFWFFVNSVGKKCSSTVPIGNHNGALSQSLCCGSSMARLTESD